MDEPPVDLLVVGGGLTGLIAGLRCADKHSVTVSKGATGSAVSTETRKETGRNTGRQHGSSFVRPIYIGKRTGRRKTMETRDRGTGARCLRAVLRAPEERDTRRPSWAGQAPRKPRRHREGVGVSRSSLTWDRIYPSHLGADVVIWPSLRRC